MEKREREKDRKGRKERKRGDSEERVEHNFKTKYLCLEIN